MPGRGYDFARKDLPAGDEAVMKSVVSKLLVFSLGLGIGKCIAILPQRQKPTNGREPS